MGAGSRWALPASLCTLLPLMDQPPVLQKFLTFFIVIPLAAVAGNHAGDERRRGLCSGWGRVGRGAGAPTLRRPGTLWQAPGHGRKFDLGVFDLFLTRYKRRHGVFRRLQRCAQSAAIEHGARLRHLLGWRH